MINQKLRELWEKKASEGEAWAIQKLKELDVSQDNTAVIELGMDGGKVLDLKAKPETPKRIPKRTKPTSFRPTPNAQFILSKIKNKSKSKFINKAIIVLYKQKMEARQ